MVTVSAVPNGWRTGCAVIGGAACGSIIGGVLGLILFMVFVPQTDPLFAIGHVTLGTTCGAAVGGLLAYWLARPSASAESGDDKPH